MEETFSIYFKNKSEYLKAVLLREHEYYIYKFQRYLRKEEKSRNILSKIYYHIKRNSYGKKLGFTIPIDVFGDNLHIWHYGNIVINRGAKVGSNCSLHGSNCIGNNGIDNKCPTIGNNVDIGVGAKVIGGIYIADNIKIGAGAVVVKSCYKEGVTLVGVPAQVVERTGEGATNGV